MYAVEVREHIMIAHSFRGQVFGPAQKLHGATFIVDVAFMASALTEDGIVCDIARAHDAVKEALEPLNLKNLDDVPAFEGKNSTTEVVAKHVFDSIADFVRRGELGPGGEGVERLRVTLHESHVARAWYEAELTS